VVLVRYRPGVTGQTARTVHVIPLPTDKQVGAVSAWCGVLLRLHDIETVTLGEGMPCTVCVVNHITGTTPVVEPDASNPDSADATSPIGGATYQAWGWPVTCYRHQVRLSLTNDTVALVIPALLAAEVTAILVARRCPPPVLVHPEAPEHRIVLAGERYGVALPWPPGVARGTGALLLPPTVTPRGPITWVHPPQPDALRRCREVDVFTALRTALRDSRRPATWRWPTHLRASAGPPPPLSGRGWPGWEPPGVPDAGWYRGYCAACTARWWAPVGDDGSG
jgi:hypothetical protein